MKSQILICLLILFNAITFAQEDTEFAKLTRLDFAIPEHPAFSILDNNPDNVLRPNNSQELFSLIYSNFLSGTTPIFPKDLSLEVAPAQLIGINNITLEGYQKNRIFYDTKLSIAAKSDNDNDALRNLAVGLRIPWVDRSSLAYNAKALDKMYEQMHKDLEYRKKFKDNLIAKNAVFNNTPITNENIARDDAMETHVNKMFEEYINEEKKSAKDTLKHIAKPGMKEIREKYKKLSWNKLKIESAAAIKYRSDDSLARNSHYSKFQLYNTIAFPLGNSNKDERPGWGQGLLGINFSDERIDSITEVIIDSSQTGFDTLTFKETNLTIAARLYAGTNAFKAFVEMSYKTRLEKTESVSLNVGSEINLTDGLWAVISFGNDWMHPLEIKESNWSSQWFWNIDLRFHLPEKKKL